MLRGAVRCRGALRRCTILGPLCIVKRYRRKYTNGHDALDLQVHRITKMRQSVCHPLSALLYCLLYVCVLYAFVPHLFNQHIDNLFSNGWCYSHDGRAWWHVFPILMTAHILLMAPPIECDLGYRFRTLTLPLTLTLTLTLTLILKLTLTLTLSVKV